MELGHLLFLGRYEEGFSLGRLPLLSMGDEEGQPENSILVDCVSERG